MVTPQIKSIFIMKEMQPLTQWGFLSAEEAKEVIDRFNKHGNVDDLIIDIRRRTTNIVDSREKTIIESVIKSIGGENGFKRVL